MKSIDLFVPYVEIHCQGASVPLMQQALRTAAQDFCNRSHIIQSTFLADTVAGTADVDIELPSQQQFVRLMAARWKDTDLATAATSDTPPNIYDPFLGTPEIVYLKSPSVGPVSLYPIPDLSETAVLSIRAAFAPTNTATQFDDVLYTDWVDVIAAGAIASLQGIQNQPFSARALNSHSLRFERGVELAKRVAARGRIITSRRVQYRAFA